MHIRGDAGNASSASSCHGSGSALKSSLTIVAGDCRQRIMVEDGMLISVRPDAVRKRDKPEKHVALDNENGECNDNAEGEAYRERAHGINLSRRQDRSGAAVRS